MLNIFMEYTPGGSISSLIARSGTGCIEDMGLLKHFTRQILLGVPSALVRLTVQCPEGRCVQRKGSFNSRCFFCRKDSPLGQGVTANRRRLTASFWFIKHRLRVKAHMSSLYQ